jgi:HEAT repeat protein
MQAHVHLTKEAGRHLSYICLLLFLFQGGIRNCWAHDEWFRGLDLEPALGEASLVMVARVADVSETRILVGGKAETTLRQFKFAPAQVLKGVFSRESLSLTSEDLGINNYPDSPPIESGQLRLLMLGRSYQGYTALGISPSLDQAIPPLSGVNDTLIQTCKVLLEVHAAPDRSRMVALLLEGLRAEKGPAAIPLLVSLERRSLLAAQTPGVMAGVLLHLSDGSPSVREQAAKAVGSLLDADYLDQPVLRYGAANALMESLSRTDQHFEPRVAMFEALGAVGPDLLNRESTQELLEPDPPATFVEEGARLRALGDLQVPGQVAAVLSVLHQLPLDAPTSIQYGAEWALAKLDPAAAMKEIMARARNKSSSGLLVVTEIKAAGDLPPTYAVPALLQLSRLPIGHAEREAFVDACDNVAEKSRDDRLVAPLAHMLEPSEPDVRWVAVDALLKVDTEDAAKALRPQLGPEADLFRKLQIAELLGRHGIRDGYPYAIEHMSEPRLREQAISALVAIRQPGAIARLREVLVTSNDVEWNTAAVRALGRLGAHDLAPEFLEMARDSRSPLAPSAVVALGDLHDSAALAIVRTGLNSRSREMLTASARAAGNLAGLPSANANDVRDQLAALLADPQASQQARAAALDSLVALNDPRLDGALAQAVRDAGLEGSDLLNRIEQLLRERKVKLTLP